jgi:hypothetical protein
MVIFFFCKICSYTKRKTSHGDFSIGMVQNWPYKLPQKSMDEKSSPGKNVVIHKPQIGAGSSKGLIQSRIMNCDWLRF